MITVNRCSLAALFLSLMLLVGCAATPAFSRRENGDVLRLHVIANSDSPADQAVKLQVRDAILSHMEKTDSAAKAEAFVRANGKTLFEAAEKVLKDNGFSYSVQLMLGQYDFPDRTYGEAFFPAGEYNALRVVLGNGAGQNWWCVLFPPLCIVTEESVAVDPDDIYFSSSILEWLKKWGVIA